MVVLSTGRSGAELREDRDRVSYNIRKAGVEPVGRAGMVRLFPESSVTAIWQSLEARDVPGESPPRVIRPRQHRPRKLGSASQNT
jgi:hypothetical protein